MNEMRFRDLFTIAGAFALLGALGLFLTQIGYWLKDGLWTRFAPADYLNPVETLDWKGVQMALEYVAGMQGSALLFWLGGALILLGTVGE